MSTSIYKNIPDDLKQLVLDQTWYDHKSLEDFSVWELREALSYLLDLHIFLTSDQNQQAKIAVKHILDKNDLVELPRDFLVQARIQQLLRLKRIELKCYGLIEFPLTVSGIYNTLDYSSKSWISIYWVYTKKILKSNLIIVLLLSIIVYNIFFFNLTLLLVGMLVAYITHFLLQIIEHDYNNHRYIVPKISILEKFFKFLICLSIGDSNPLNFKANHLHHHYYWNTSKDFVTEMIRLNEYGPYDFLFSREYESINSNYINLCRITEIGDKKFNNENRIYRFLSQNQKLMLVLFCLLGFLLVNFGFMINFCLMIIVWHAIAGKFPDAALYISNKQKDFPYLWPIMLRDAWHYSHHIKYQNKNFNKIEDLFFGPPWLKYFNFEYYVMKIFFKINT